MLAESSGTPNRSPHSHNREATNRRCRRSARRGDIRARCKTTEPPRRRSLARRRSFPRSTAGLLRCSPLHRSRRHNRSSYRRTRSKSGRHSAARTRAACTRCARTPSPTNHARTPEARRGKARMHRPHTKGTTSPLVGLERNRHQFCKRPRPASLRSRPLHRGDNRRSRRSDPQPRSGHRRHPARSHHHFRWRAEARSLQRLGGGPGT
jgi:hypothetical protein